MLFQYNLLTNMHQSAIVLWSVSKYSWLRAHNSLRFFRIDGFGIEAPESRYKREFLKPVGLVQ